MGNWNMTVTGVGAHHNGDRNLAYDADRMFKEFVQQLNDAGHLIQHASITFGARETIVNDPNRQ